MSKVHVKVNDKVYILTGKDAGKTGKVLEVLPTKERVIVEGVNLNTKHTKPKSQFQTGGIIKKELPISSSNVMLVCESCKKPSKVGKKIMDNGEKIRFCKACGETIDVIKAKK